MKVKAYYVGLIDNREKAADVSACECSAIKPFPEWVLHVVRNNTPLGYLADKIILEA